MLLDEEISNVWCVGGTWRCTPYEAAGLWSVIFFYATVLVGTILHSYCQHQSGAAERDEDATRRHAEAHADGGPDAVVPCLLVVYFFSFSAGCLLWAAAGVRWVHPVQSGPVQLAGAALLLTCTLLFVATHMSMGENWSPQPEVKVQHQLVTRGVFRWARHPMYAVFLWASIGTLLATLNWLIAWCVFGSVLVTFRRIETEERILMELYGSQWLAYRQRVRALGPPWCCLGFDAASTAPVRAAEEEEEEEEEGGGGRFVQS